MKLDAKKQKKNINFLEFYKFLVTAIIIQQLGAESFPDSIYFYTKNFIAWTKYNKESDVYTTEYKKINIPQILHLPLFRALRMFYAKRQLVGNKPIYAQLFMLVLQYLLSLKFPLVSFLFPYLLFAFSLTLFNLTIKYVPNHPIENQMRNHAAEHFIAEKEMFEKETIYSFGCSNSQIVFCYLVNLFLIFFFPVVPAYILSIFISGELIIWLLFHQDSFIAKLFYPLIVEVQNFTLLEPHEEHLKTATLAMNKLKELEDEN